MIIEYATWVVDAPDRDAYLAWMLDVTARCRSQAGCLAYDFRIDPGRPDHGSLFQAWETPEHFAAHLDFPAHQEMLTGGKPWVTRDVVLQRWTDAEGHQVIER